MFKLKKNEELNLKEIQDEEISKANLQRDEIKRKLRQKQIRDA